MSVMKFLRVSFSDRADEAIIPDDLLAEQRRRDVLPRFYPMGVTTALIAGFSGLSNLARGADGAGYLVATLQLTLAIIITTIVLLGRRGYIPPSRADIVVYIALSLVIIFLCLVATLERNPNVTIAVGMITLVGGLTFSRLRYAIYFCIQISIVMAIVRSIGGQRIKTDELAIGQAIYFLIMIVVFRARDRMQSLVFSHRWEADQRNLELAEMVVKLQEEVSDRCAAEAEVREKEKVLRSLSHQLLTVQEDERARIARELHDELGQTLTATKISLQSLKRKLGKEDRERVDEPLECVGECIQRVRGLSMELRPALLDHLGLETALRWNAQRMESRTSIPISVETVNGHDRYPLPVEAAGYRIAQEAITNALRHAEPKNIRVRCESADDRLRLSVSDDGKGFDVAGVTQQPTTDRGLGILGMRERAESLGGRVVISSTPGSGTRVEVEFPRTTEAPKESTSVVTT